MTMAVPAVLPVPGLDDALYREAEARRQRQHRREEEVWAQAQRQAKPKLGRASRVLCQGRLERELQEAFDGAGGQADSIALDLLPDVLAGLGLIGGVADGEDAFCSRLGLLLDKEKCGLVSFDRLLAFLCRALDLDGQELPRSLHPSLEEECFDHLEQQLSKAFGRLLSNRLSRPKTVERERRAASATAMVERPQTPPRSFSPTSGPFAGPPTQAWATPRALTTQSRPSSAPRSRGAEATAISRCHLLYHQAIFASRESAKLEEDIKALKEKEETRECTFKPKLLPARRGSSPMPQPRNFDATIARMRSAQQRRDEHQKEKEHISRGENYERLRRRGTQPFSVALKDRVPARPPPLMYIDVNVGRGRTGRIAVHEGDDFRLVSRNFARTFQLDGETAQRLEDMLRRAYDEHRRGLGRGDAAGRAEAGAAEVLPAGPEEAAATAATLPEPAAELSASAALETDAADTSGDASREIGPSGL